MIKVDRSLHTIVAALCGAGGQGDAREAAELLKAKSQE